tara:strand:- start:450 stop:1265 length:816 start_codon:yes stop_codon:yes gene_type:complete
MVNWFFEYRGTGPILAILYVIFSSMLPCLPDSQASTRAQYCPPQEEKTVRLKNGDYASVLLFQEEQRKATEHPCGGGIVCRFLLPPAERFISRTFEDPIAAFTLILTLSTIGLWLATKSAIRKAELSSERQLRAYPFITTAIRMSGHHVALAFQFVITNSGQTPAYDVTISTYHDVDLLTAPPRTKLTKEQNASLIGPGQGMTHEIELDAPLSREELDAIAEGHLGYFVQGEIFYRDAFDKERRTHFRLVYQRSGISRGWLAYSDVGNYAD